MKKIKVQTERPFHSRKTNKYNKLKHLWYQYVDKLSTPKIMV